MDLISFSLVLGIIWGAFWAMFIQFVPLGQFLAKKRTWVTVIVGVGIDLLIGLLVVPFQYWWPISSIIAVSSLGIIYRSLYNEQSQDDPEKIRLKNKMIWGLEDIIALSKDARSAFNKIKMGLQKKEEFELLASAIIVIEKLVEIERAAMNARQGKYEEV